ncbi:MAG: hypothetical protein KJ955_05910 [Nanoarchaeota archaeon]|nr:hypothetical protein [Nanoarchaeota archaeon]
MNYKILNTREIKAILEELKEHFEAKADIKEAMIEGAEGKIHLISRKLAELPMDKVRINSMGMYFCKKEKGGLRPTIEGCQILKPTKNVFEMDEKQRDAWMHGKDLEVGKQELNGMVIVKHNNDFYGAGAYKEGRILNMVPKERRIRQSKRIPEDKE